MIFARWDQLGAMDRSLWVQHPISELVQWGVQNGIPFEDGLVGHSGSRNLRVSHI